MAKRRSFNWNLNLGDIATIKSARGAKPFFSQPRQPKMRLPVIRGVESTYPSYKQTYTRLAKSFKQHAQRQPIGGTIPMGLPTSKRERVSAALEGSRIMRNVYEGEAKPEVMERFYQSKGLQIKYRKPHIEQIRQPLKGSPEEIKNFEGYITQLPWASKQWKSKQQRVVVQKEEGKGRTPYDKLLAEYKMTYQSSGPKTPTEIGPKELQEMMESGNREYEREIQERKRQHYERKETFEKGYNLWKEGGEKARTPWNKQGEGVPEGTPTMYAYTHAPLAPATPQGTRPYERGARKVLERLYPQIQREKERLVSEAKKIHAKEMPGPDLSTESPLSTAATSLPEEAEWNEQEHRWEVPHENLDKVAEWEGSKDQWLSQGVSAYPLERDKARLEAEDRKRRYALATREVKIPYTTSKLKEQIREERAERFYATEKPEMVEKKAIPMKRDEKMEEFSEIMEEVEAEEAAEAK
jgi:hypothetical protein